MIIAAAQTRSYDGDVNANIKIHCRFVEEAARYGARFILFPEMSLTGYEKERASELSFSTNDDRLTELQILSVKHNMVIVAGAPLKTRSGLHIGAFIVSPDRPMNIYTKQFLHAGEEQFFTSASDHNPVIICENERLAFAICADITNPVHPANAAANNATLYAAGIFYTPGGISLAYQQLSGYAKIHSMGVLMANYVGNSYKLQSAGQSAYWDCTGQLKGKLNDETEGLLVVDCKDGINESNTIYF